MPHAHALAHATDASPFAPPRPTRRGDTPVPENLNDRIGIARGHVLVSPSPGDPAEAWGVLNPASARAADGTLHLFPRIVAEGNLSRVGHGVVRTDDHGHPESYERLLPVLEPEQSWERNARTAGTEDPRITRIDALDRWVMTYAAYGPLGPRVALAVSDDLETWQRLGPVRYRYERRHGIDWNLPLNKDALFFPQPVTAPSGEPAIAVLHRPMFDLGEVTAGAGTPLPTGIPHERLGIWISYIPLEAALADPRALLDWQDHELVALPEHDWEHLKIGAGTPPVLTPDGWLVLHHGVKGRLLPNTDHQPHVVYSAGALLLDRDDPRIVLERSTEALLEPETEAEREGIVPNVVFPTAIEQTGSGEFVCFYGMADSRIGWFQLTYRQL